MASRGLAELAPADLNDNAKTALEVVDFIGKGALASKIGATADRVAKNWWRSLTNRERGIQVLKINQATQEGKSLGEALRERMRRAKQEGRYEQEMESAIRQYVWGGEKPVQGKPAGRKPGAAARPAPEPTAPTEAPRAAEAGKPAEVKILEQTRKLAKPAARPKFGRAVPMPPEQQPYGAEPIEIGPEKPNRSQAEIERWKDILSKNKKKGTERLQKYLASLTLGRNFNEKAEDFFKREGLTEFVEWAKPIARGEKPDKEPWKMLPEEFLEDVGAVTRSEREAWRERHKEKIQQAQEQGKSVPDEVLAEYPDLKTAEPP